MEIITVKIRFQSKKRYSFAFYTYVRADSNIAIMKQSLQTHTVPFA